MKVLTKTQIIMLHNNLITEYGGTEGLRDEGLLDSAITAPFHVFGSHEAQASLHEIFLQIASSEATFDDLLQWVVAHKCK